MPGASTGELCSGWLRPRVGSAVEPVRFPAGSWSVTAGRAAWRDLVRSPLLPFHPLTGTGPKSAVPNHAQAPRAVRALWVTTTSLRAHVCEGEGQPRASRPAARGHRPKVVAVMVLASHRALWGALGPTLRGGTYAVQADQGQKHPPPSPKVRATLIGPDRSPYQHPIHSFAVRRTGGEWSEPSSACTRSS